MSNEFQISRRAALAGLAGACTLGLQRGAFAQSGDKSDAEVVRVGVVKVAGVSDIFTAQKLGYFKDEGVNVQTTVIRSGAEGQAAVVSGQMEFLPLNSASMILGLHQNFGFKAAADGFRAPERAPGTSAIVVRSDGPVASPKDLEGKTVGIVTRKALHELYLVLWCAKNGVDLKKLRLIEVPYAQMIDVLLSKQVDAVIPLEPMITRGISDGKAKVLAYYDTEVEPGHANGLWVGMGKWVDAHPIATRKFQAGIYRAQDYLNKNPREADKLIAEWTGLPADLVAKMGKDLFKSEMPVASLEGQVKSMRELGWIEREVKVADALWKASA
jgi:NitT/TauT family transport system substrate-binding protein